MAQYDVDQRPGEAGGWYACDIFCEGRKVAKFGHSQRSDEPMLQLSGGEWEPFDDILVDDEPPRHRVSRRGAQLLDERLTEGRP